MKAIRGAITVSANTPEAIAEATQTLLAELAWRNKLQVSEVISAFFTLTADLNADYPARAARLMGWDMPMLDTQEIAVPDSLERCLRVLLHVQRDGPVRHAYLRGAARLRPDLEERGIIAAGECTPSLESLRESQPRGPCVAVSREILADLDTPVSAFLKLRGHGASFLLESAEGGERIGRYSFIGANPRRVLRVKSGRQWFDGGPSAPCLDPLNAVQAIVGAYGQMKGGNAPFEGGALGYLSYESARYFERLPLAVGDPLDLPDAAFMDIDTLLIFDHITRRVRIVSHAWLDRPLEQAYREAAGRIEWIARRLEAPVERAPLLAPTTDRAASNMSRTAFEEMVRSVKENIAAGDILQAVVAQRLEVPLSGDPFGLYRRLRTVSPAPYMYYLDFVDHQIVGASPELLIQVQDGMVTSRPIAGTRPRGATPEQDDDLAGELVADEKECAEHLMLVDLARNDVGRVSRPGTVTVRRFMQVERFSHVMHLVSDVNGGLAEGCTAYDALRAAFPAGTVSGAPKIKAMQIIAGQEPDQRGPYAGAVGFFNTRGDMETCITIRTGVVKDGVLTVQVGAGIVADSEPDREYQETLNKARALLEAAGVEHDPSD
ncbi:MAG: anthranilate synthase component I [Chloroflexota bacterium]